MASWIWVFSEAERWQLSSAHQRKAQLPDLLDRLLLWKQWQSCTC
jgi:hypothetical protein